MIARTLDSGAEVQPNHLFGMSVKAVGGHFICPHLVPREAVVVDIGANCGVFTNAMTKCFAAKVIAVEPSPVMFNKLEKKEGVELVNMAISDAPGESNFYLRANSEVSSLRADYPGAVEGLVKVETITLPMLLERYCLSWVDVLKIDAEGAELVMFSACSDETLLGFGQICVEFHEWLGVGTRQDVKEIIARVERVGFRVFSLVRGNFQAVLFVNRGFMNSWQHRLTWLRIWSPRMCAFGVKRLLRQRRG